MIVFSFLAAVLLHECGHLFALFLFKAEILTLRFSLGGLTIRHTPLPSPLSAWIVSASGPIFGIFGYIASQASLSFALFSRISLLLSLFNLLPITSLDGAGMAAVLLNYFCSPSRAYALQKGISHLCLLFLWVCGSYLFFLQNSSPSLFLLSLTLFCQELRFKDSSPSSANLFENN